MHTDSKFASTLVSVLALAALPLSACKKPETPAGPQPSVTAENTPPVRVTLATAEARQVPDVLSATGTLVPDQQSQVTPLVGGRVTAVLVERGSQVREGQPMLRLRDVDYRTNAATASAVVSQSRSRLGLDGNGRFDAESTAEVRAAAAQRDIADDGLRRAEQLHTSGSMSDAEYQRVLLQATAAREQYRSALNGTRASYFAYQQARETLASAQRAVSDSVVRAPFSGEVAERMANVGEYVTAQRAVVTLVKIDTLRMEIQVPQERFAQVRPDQTVDIRVDAWPERTFRGTLRYISAHRHPRARGRGGDPHRRPGAPPGALRHGAHRAWHAALAGGPPGAGGALRGRHEPGVRGDQQPGADPGGVGARAARRRSDRRARRGGG